MSKRSSFLLVYKPPGITSFASLYPVKRKIDKKVGHAGTLDKFAQGLMIVLTGSFTKLNPIFSMMDKSYLATICFGTETSTLDPEG
ncbi:MAG: tRNA pseudouridine(55) synthase TruB, partial [Spirochaetae bacterium HGW-Spirochaetae-8]